MRPIQPHLQSLYWHVISMSAEERAAFASRAGTTPGSLSHVLHGRRKMRAELAMRIEIASAGAFRAEAICKSAPWQEWQTLRNAVQRSAPTQKRANAEITGG